MYGKMKEQLEKTLAEIEAAGLFKRERVIRTPQGVGIGVEFGGGSGVRGGAGGGGR